MGVTPPGEAMLRFVLVQGRLRPVRTITLGSALALASLSFVLLSAAARTSDLRTTGSVETNFRNAYDILVRPRDSFTELERREGLVRNNYLGGIFGGITLRAYERIKRIPGVEIAAPIANVGYVMTTG